VFLGIRFEVKGAENVPDQPCVILSNHQSTWETFFLSAYFSPLSQVLKRELLYVPFFGWAMAMLRPIAMDRDNRWDRVSQAYNLIVDGQAEFNAATAQEGLEAAYARGESDEFVKATTVGEPVKVEDGDAVV
ncbi:lysophospholipid acyltransferase family protein, partial [Streptococcus cuniculi]